MQDQTPTASLPPVAKAERIDLVFVVDGRTLAHPLPRAGRVVIGRACEGVSVSHASLSRRHAAITTPGVASPLQDLGSTNGTRGRARPCRRRGRGAAREPLPRHALSPEHTVRLGAVTLVLVPAAEPPSPDAAGGAALDPAMREVHALIDRVAPAEIPVLLLGETGVGKEVLAERGAPRLAAEWVPRLRLNRAGPRRDPLVQSELFGH